jgi:hypothetical protein
MENHDKEDTSLVAPRVSEAKVLTPKKKINAKKIIIIAVVVILLAAILAMVGVSVVAKDTLPGDPLYAFKTTISEEVIAATKFSSIAKGEYAVTRLENRLRELQLLAADTATSSDEVLNQIMGLSQAHVEVARNQILNNDSITLENKVDGLAAFAQITRAQEILVDDTEEFTVITGTAGDIESFSNDALRSTIDTYASTTDQILLVAYLEKHIALVAETLPTVANGSRAQDLARRRIDDTNEAILDKDLGSAIYFILKAKEAIAVDGYLYAAERGYVDGITGEAGPIPEGN